MKGEKGHWNKQEENHLRSLKDLFQKKDGPGI